ncbi:glycoside hydrolase [Hysterangium stoloniferum]|nr:glycoside hydrolase [Hysterangium stoloniferum]
MKYTYLWPFAEAVWVGIGSVIKLLNGALKEELDFQGFIPAIAGLDMNMPGFRATAKRLDDMVTHSIAAFFKLGQDNGTLPSILITVLRTHSLVGCLLMSLLSSVFSVQADHYKLIREVGSASTDLLKNTNNTIPLSTTKNIKCASQLS